MNSTDLPEGVSYHSLNLKSGEEMVYHIDVRTGRHTVSMWKSDDECHWSLEYPDRANAVAEWDRWKNN